MCIHISAADCTLANTPALAVVPMSELITGAGSAGDSSGAHLSGVAAGTEEAGTGGDEQSARRAGHRNPGRRIDNQDGNQRCPSWQCQHSCELLGQAQTRLGHLRQIPDALNGGYTSL